MKLSFKQFILSKKSIKVIVIHQLQIMYLYVELYSKKSIKQIWPFSTFFVQYHRKRAWFRWLRHTFYECWPHLLGDSRGLSLVQFEDSLHDADLCGGGGLPGKGTPVVHNNASTDHLATPVHSTGYQGNLKIGLAINGLYFIRGNFMEANWGLLPPKSCVSLAKL